MQKFIGSMTLAWALAVWAHAWDQSEAEQIGSWDARYSTLISLEGAEPSPPSLHASAREGASSAPKIGEPIGSKQLQFLTWEKVVGILWIGVLWWLGFRWRQMRLRRDNEDMETVLSRASPEMRESIEAMRKYLVDQGLSPRIILFHGRLALRLEADSFRDEDILSVSDTWEFCFIEPAESVIVQKWDLGLDDADDGHWTSSLQPQWVWHSYANIVQFLRDTGVIARINKRKKASLNIEIDLVAELKSYIIYSGLGSGLTVIEKYLHTRVFDKPTLHALLEHMNTNSDTYAQYMDQCDWIRRLIAKKITTAPEPKSIEHLWVEWGDTTDDLSTWATRLEEILTSGTLVPLSASARKELEKLQRALAKALNRSGIADAGTTGIAPLVASSALTGESAPEWFDLVGLTDVFAQLENWNSSEQRVIDQALASGRFSPSLDDNKAHTLEQIILRLKMIAVLKARQPDAPRIVSEVALIATLSQDISDFSVWAREGFHTFLTSHDFWGNNTTYNNVISRCNVVDFNVGLAL